MGCCASNDDNDEKKDPLILGSVDNNSLTSLKQTHRKSAQELLLSWNLQHYYDILVAKDYLPIDKWEYLDKNTLMFELNFAPDDATNFIAEVSMYFEERRKSHEKLQMKKHMKQLAQQIGGDIDHDTEQLRHHDEHDHTNHNHQSNQDTIDLPDEKNVSQTISVQQEDDVDSDEELHNHNHTHKIEHSHSHSNEHDIDDTPHGDDDDIIQTQTTDNIVIEDQSDLGDMIKQMDKLRRESGLDDTINVDELLKDDLNNNNTQVEEFENDIEADELHKHVETRNIDLDESDDLSTEDEDM